MRQVKLRWRNWDDKPGIEIRTGNGFVVVYPDEAILIGNTLMDMLEAGDPRTTSCESETI